MFKKPVCYLSLLLLASPLVATAGDVPFGDPPPVQATLARLSVACPALAAGVDFPTMLSLQAFYQQNAGQAVWSDDERLMALRVQLQQLADDGLDPARYSLPAADTSLSPDCVDIAISQRYLQALHELRFGYLSQDRLEPVWKASPQPQDRQAMILAIAGPGLNNLAAAFDQARPSLDLYRNLRVLYAQQRQQPLAEWQAVPAGALLQPDKQDARVPALARRLFSEGYLTAPPAEGDEHYSPSLVEAMKSFQLRHSLQADGVVGPWTVTELNVSSAMRREQLRINLERMRWLAQDLEPDSVLVNVAAAQLTVYQGGAPVWQTRTQVGRAGRETPLLKSRVTRLTLNPTWTIPPTILKEDKLPEIRRDPEFLSRQNLKIIDRDGLPLLAEDIDWDHPGDLMLRQDAGPKNPLGKLVIRFPNPFSVYLHDTPSQALFSKGPRAFSSGCVRIEQVMHLRDLLVTPAERLRTDTLLADGQTHEFRLTRPMPILLGYWTVQADSQGQAVYVPDVYGRDGKLAAARGRAL
ncbi:L,D-transpeptidase family protein [Pseudomonas mediterranea]|uniref:L,D-transpeptidase family protein n=1 Tax=Pseudomonas mediterranea TaxID=183795 RepID=UPI00191E6436|nr:L,D-transpeptidase family protein [Pseudomonas mediterranea]MBL0841714.1 L,D-transpeptidase family protein [Pseudomonas mediterranea]UZD98720.1 L,D-transpeptidase family protein [Pseudomonas mediterranea]